MKPWLHRLEVLTDRIIPYSLIVLFILIIAELFFYEAVRPYERYIDLADYTIILIFLVDLGFKYNRARNIKGFLKGSWLDIIAVMPAFLVLAMTEVVASLARLDVVADTIHSTLESGSRFSRVVRETEEAGQVSRLAHAERFIRPLARLPRFAKALVFFEKQIGSHHPFQPLPKRKRAPKGKNSLQQRL